MVSICIVVLGGICYNNIEGNGFMFVIFRILKYLCKLRMFCGWGGGGLCFVYLLLIIFNKNENILNNCIYRVIYLFIYLF